MSIPIIESSLKLITEGIKYLTLLSKTSHVRRMRKAVDYGETFILLFDELVNTDDEKKERQITNRMKIARKRFFKYNQ